MKMPSPPILKKGDVMVTWMWSNPREDVNQFGKLVSIQRAGHVLSAEFSIVTKTGKERLKTTWVYKVTPKTTLESLMKGMYRMYGRKPNYIGIFKFDGSRMKSVARSRGVRLIQVPWHGRAQASNPRTSKG